MKLFVTGGTGSFGHAVVDRYLGRNDIEEIIVYSRDEKKQDDMRQEYRNEKKLTFIVGDVRDRNALRQALRRGVDVIFHAAALKQVPSGEFFPWEVVKTNVLGTQNLADIASLEGIKKMVLLSTDKAVQPVNAMGMSKALAEKTMTAYSRISDKTTFCAVRYGNVAASRGSVIPRFVECIKSGKTLPITVPEMTRFMLSLDDAVDLVELAVEKGQQGDIFIKKSPAATVADLAQAVLDVFDSKLPTEIVGIREGEKIHECLAHELELAHAEDMKTHFRIRTNRNYDYESYFDKSGTKAKPFAGPYTSENTERLTIPEVKEFLLRLPYIQSELKGQA